MNLVSFCKKIRIGVIYQTNVLVQLHIINSSVLFYKLLHLKCLYYTVQNNNVVDDAKKMIESYL